MNGGYEHVLGTEPPTGLGPRAQVALVGFAVIAAYFLWTEHRAHVIQLLPWTLVALCPLMHLLMHGGHGHGANRPESSHRSAGGHIR